MTVSSTSRVYLTLLSNTGMLIFSIQTLSDSDLIIEAIVQIYYRHIYRETKTIITVLDFWYDIQTHKRWIKQITNKMTPDYFMQAACIFHMDLTLYAIQICEKEKKKVCFQQLTCTLTSFWQHCNSGMMVLSWPFTWNVRSVIKDHSPTWRGARSFLWLLSHLASLRDQWDLGSLSRRLV